MIHLLRADNFISYLPDTGSRFSLDMSLMDYCSCHLSDHMATHFAIITIQRQTLPIQFGT